MRHAIRWQMWTGVMATTALVAASATSACGKGDSSAASASREPVQSRITANAPAKAAGVGGDSDIAARGNSPSLPAGYFAQFDRADSKPSDVSYSAREPGRWEVKTGGAHILYSPRDSARGKYSASATFEQVEAPAHPEGFGVIIGGSSLDQPAARKYTYFLVRGDGDYLIKVRDGAHTRTITDWTPNAAVPKQDAAGKALYGIKVAVDGNTARVSVNGAPVATIAAKDAPLNGVAGVRVNHNLHVIVTPVSVTR